MSTADGLGFYLHVPFCRHRCDYCAFAAWDDRDGLVDRYMRALAVDVARQVGTVDRPFTSVFVGGGTPSRVPPRALVDAIRPVPLAPGAEVTVEVNPEDGTVELFETYLSGGVNRVSFGVQSMVDDVLASLGRRHDPDAVARAVDAARTAGLSAVNLDLIYGAAGESLGDWERTVRGAMALEPQHVSAYALTIEAGTPLANEPDRHPDDDDQAAKYELVDDLMSASGRPWYEISNWALPGAECRHNQLYWMGGDYLGAGCAAHAHVDGRRWWNIRTPDRYVDAVEAGEVLEAGSEQLTSEARRLETLQLEIRTSRGVPDGSFDEADLVGVLGGLVEQVGERWVLTRRGRLLANEVALRIR